METIKEVVNTQEEIAPAQTEEEVVNDSPEAAAETESTAATVEKTTSNTETTNEEPPKTTKKQEFSGNLLYEESLGFVPGNHGGSHDPRYVFCKFRKDYKDFDYTNEDILKYLEEIDLLNYLRLLQISKPNKSIDIMFRTEDAADFFVNQHIEVRGKPLPFVRKAKRILKVIVKGVHPEMPNDLMLSELYEYTRNCTRKLRKEIKS